MPYQHLDDGLYLIKQKSAEKGVDHYGVLDIGNRIRHPAADGINPVVVHKGTSGFRIDWFQNTGTWDVVGKVIDEAGALERLQRAFKDPNYDLFGSNCEHFARFVATGKHESTQVQAAVIIGGLASLALLALLSEG